MYNLINVWVTFATRINRYIFVITVPWGLRALLTSAPVTVLLAPNSCLHQKASNLAFNQAKSLLVCSNLVCPGVYTLTTVSFHLLPAHPYPLFPLPSYSFIFTLSFCTSFLLIHIHSVFLYFLPTHPLSSMRIPLQLSLQQHIPSHTTPQVFKSLHLLHLFPTDPPSSTAICCPHNYITLLLLTSSVAIVNHTSKKYFSLAIKHPRRNHKL